MMYMVPTSQYETDHYLHRLCQGGGGYRVQRLTLKYSSIARFANCNTCDDWWAAYLSSALFSDGVSGPGAGASVIARISHSKNESCEEAYAV